MSAGRFRRTLFLMMLCDAYSISHGFSATLYMCVEKTVSCFHFYHFIIPYFLTAISTFHPYFNVMISCLSDSTGSKLSNDTSFLFVRPVVTEILSLTCSRALKLEKWGTINTLIFFYKFGPECPNGQDDRLPNYRPGFESRLVPKKLQCGLY